MESIVPVTRDMSLDHRLQSIIEWIGQTADAASGRGVLVPVSGGTDSALCFWLCAKALPRGRAIAAYAGSSLRCSAWFASLGTLHLLPEPDGSPKEREALRWAMMLSHGRKHRCWLAGSRNRTEEVLGTYSLASRASTYLPLAGLWKSQVMELSAIVGVPEEIRRSSLLADPVCDRPPEMADIPFEMVDLFLQVNTGERPQSHLSQLTAGHLQYLQGIYQRNQFKKSLPLRPPSASASCP